MDNVLDVLRQWGTGLGAALLPILVVYVCNLIREWAVKIGDERLRELVLELVRAAEQLFTGEERGPERLMYVKRQLEKRGLAERVPHEAIEAAVYKLNSGLA